LLVGAAWIVSYVVKFVVWLLNSLGIIIRTATLPIINCINSNSSCPAIYLNFPLGLIMTPASCWLLLPVEFIDELADPLRLVMELLVLLAKAFILKVQNWAVLWLLDTLILNLNIIFNWISFHSVNSPYWFINKLSLITSAYTTSDLINNCLIILFCFCKRYVIFKLTFYEFRLRIISMKIVQRVVSIVDYIMILTRKVAHLSVDPLSCSLVSFYSLSSIN